MKKLKWITVAFLLSLGIPLNAQQNYTYSSKNRYFNKGYLDIVGFQNINEDIYIYFGCVRIKYFNLGGFRQMFSDDPYFIRNVDEDDYFTSINTIYTTGPWGLSYPLYYGRFSSLTANTNFYYIFNSYEHAFNENNKVKENVPAFELSLKYELPFFTISIGYLYSNKISWERAYTDGYIVDPWETLQNRLYNGFTISATISSGFFLSQNPLSNNSKSITRKKPIPVPYLSATLQYNKVDFLSNTLELELLLENRGEGEAENLKVKLSEEDPLLNNILYENTIEVIMPNAKIVKKNSINIPKLYAYNNLHLHVEIEEEDGFHASSDLLIEISKKLEEHIKDFVQKKMNEWEQRDKYEKLNEYIRRIEGNARDNKIAQLTNEALNLIVGNAYKEELSQAALVYDTESETFKIDLASFNDLYVHVPISEARAFESGFSSLTLNNTQFALQGSEILLARADLFDPSLNTSYQYDISQPVTFQSVDIQYAFKPVELNIESQIQPGAIEEQKRTLELGLADVDANIPERIDQVIKTNTYALIIGNEDYSTFQTGLSSEVNVNYAVNDASIFKEYLIKTIGVPEKNITVKTNATLGQMRQALAKLATIAEIKEGEADLIFYYSGHGLPEENTREAYLIPVDVSGSDVKSAIKLNDVYTQLTEFPAQKVTVFLDACFSGGARNQPLIAMRSAKVPPKEEVLSGNLVVFSSSSGEESSGAYKEKQHGMFTYFLLKKLQETKGDVTFRELSDYIYKQVREESVLVNDKLQTPQVHTSEGVMSLWQGWKL